MSKEVFTLVLMNDLPIANGGFMIDSTNNSNTKYQVDFGSLFQGRDRLYNKCQVRSQLISNGVVASTINSSVGVLSLVGLGSGNSLGTNGLFLMFLNPSASSVSGSSTGYFYAGVSSLPTANGTQLTTIPTGIREFNIVFQSVSGVIQADANMGNYRLVLQFELYDPIV